MSLTGATRSRAGRLGGAWPAGSAFVLVLAAVIAAPVVTVAVSALFGARDLPDGLAAMVGTTLLLMVLVGVGTLVIGVSTAWAVSAYEFPLRGVLSWLLVLPLAMPAYILGFVFLSTFDYTGPVQTAMRAVLGDELAGLPVRSTGGAAVVLVLALYPYVYLLARAAFEEAAPTAHDAARTLGAGPRRAFTRVLLPLARPSLAAGLGLVMMETLTDFATVQYFNVRTVSVGVYLTWKGTYDVTSATALASVVLLFALTVLAGERWLRGGARYAERGGRGRGLARRRLDGARGWGVAAALAAVAGAAFVLPVVRLAWWAVEGLRDDVTGLFDRRFAEHLVNSVSVAALTALACVVVSVLMSHVVRLGAPGPVRAAAHLTTVGYAVPGSVVGIGVLGVLAGVAAVLEGVGVDTGTALLATGSVLGILYAYLVRFTGPAHQAVEASFGRVPAAVTASARSLGASPWRVLARVHLPMVRPGIAVALVLVAIDAIKELPIVLLLRPFGFTTLPVWVYELASEDYWTQAALPALLIVAVAAVPVAVLLRRSRIVEMMA